MRQLRLLVSGRVQGVSFRAATQREATRLGLVGWVRNLPDGRVELVAEGPDDALAALRAWCGRGPPYAVVAAVEEAPLAAKGAFVGFTILR